PSSTLDHLDLTSSSNDATPSNVLLENKEQDRKRRKLDHLIDSTGDGSGVRRPGQFLVETPDLVASTGII
ncbi:1742_t:CDS:1, partial [Funneliformis mosseae]